jgi:hypothetical protein
MRKVLILFFFLAINHFSFGQELNCKVDLNTQQVQGTQLKQISDQLKKAIFEFMNNTRWTNHVYTVKERIDCSILINITKELGSDEYLATLQITSTRPIYKSSYESPMFNYIDENFQFKFQQFTNLEWNLTTFQNNLTSVLAYYAYVIIALDYDSFSPLGGTEYWQKAQQIVNNAQTATEKGWRSSEGNKNRYWLVENQLQPVFQGIRDCHYKYHREGLDIMSEKTDEGRANVLKAIQLLVPVYNNRPASFNMEIFFNAKTQDLINIFSQGTPDEKAKSVETLMLIDPANTSKYLRIQGQ